MTNVNFIGRACAVLIVACAATTTLADEGLAVSAAEDGTIEATRQCDVYVAGVAASRRPEPLSYRWLDGAEALTPWSDVRADGTAPLELCGLPAGRHALTLEVTDGTHRASDTMTATILAEPALVASSER